MDVALPRVARSFASSRAYQVCHRSATTPLPSCPHHPLRACLSTKAHGSTNANWAMARTKQPLYDTVGQTERKLAVLLPNNRRTRTLASHPPQQIERGLFFTGMADLDRRPPLPSTRCRLPELRLLPKHIVHYENPTAEFVGTPSWRNRRRVGKR